MKFVVAFQPVGAAKALAEDGQVALGQETDGDDRVEARLGCWLMV